MRGLGNAFDPADSDLPAPPPGRYAARYSPAPPSLSPGAEGNGVRAFRLVYLRLAAATAVGKKKEAKAEEGLIFPF